MRKESGGLSLKIKKQMRACLWPEAFSGWWWWAALSGRAGGCHFSPDPVGGRQATRLQAQEWHGCWFLLCNSGKQVQDPVRVQPPPLCSGMVALLQTFRKDTKPPLGPDESTRLSSRGGDAGQTSTLLKSTLKKMKSQFCCEFRPGRI